VNRKGQGGVRAVDIYEVLRLSCCVGTVKLLVAACLGRGADHNDGLMLRTRNRERERGADGAGAANTSAPPIGALMRASGAAVVLGWFEAIARFRVKLLQTKVGFAGLGAQSSNPWH
jgi:hypothetical protein